jgi:hypothetical protein
MTTDRYIRNTIFALIIIFLTMPLGSLVWAAIYYVDATNGSDSKSGSSESAPWKTIAKVNTSRFNPGDQILFRRGATWREQLTVPSSGSAGNVITFGAYGSGEKPIITAADIVTGWTAGSSNIN